MSAGPPGSQGGRSALAGLYLPVYLPTFLLAFAQGMLVPALPLYALTFEDSFSLVSLVVSAAGLGTVLADVPSGMLLERIGKKRAMLIGTVAIAASTVAVAFAPAYGFLILFRLVAGLGTALWNISRMAYLAEATSRSNRGRALSTFGGINRMGTFAGPAIGGIAGAVFGLQAPFLLAAGLALAAAVVSGLFIRETGVPAVRTGHKMRWSILGQLARSHWRELMTAGSAQVFAQMIRAGRAIIIPLYGTSVLGLGVAEIGTIISISAAIDMSLFIPAGMVMDRLGRKWAAVPSFAVMGIGMALIPLTSDYATLLLATGVIGLGNGLSSGTMFTLGADLAPPEAAGEFLGMWRFVGDVGMTGGPVVVGTVADLLGLHAAALALALIGLMSAGTLALFVKETLEKQPVVRTISS